MCNFRTLKANEIDVRVQQVAANSRGVFALLLLYKDARCDMNILDKVFGSMNWQREHIIKEGRNYCRVSVRDPKTGEWVSKEDVGVESNTEATKGEASDAFKRACVNFGIGRELYTAPKITVQLKNGEYYEAGKDKFGKPTYRLSSWVKFNVSAIDYDDDRNISALTIADQSGVVRFCNSDAASAQPVAASSTTAPAQPAPAKTAAPIKCITMRTLANDEQCTKMLAMLEECYRKNQDAFTVESCLRSHGFDIASGVLTILHEKWTNYITEKGI